MDDDLKQKISNYIVMLRQIIPQTIPLVGPRDHVETMSIVQSALATLCGQHIALIESTSDRPYLDKVIELIKESYERAKTKHTKIKVERADEILKQALQIAKDSII